MVGGEDMIRQERGSERRSRRGSERNDKGAREGSEGWVPATWRDPNSGRAGRLESRDVKEVRAGRGSGGGPKIRPAERCCPGLREGRRAWGGRGAGTGRSKAGPRRTVARTPRSCRGRADRAQRRPDRRAGGRLRVWYWCCTTSSSLLSNFSGGASRSSSSRTSRRRRHAPTACR